MKVVIIGASGTIGSATSKAFEEQHEVIRVTHSSGDLTIDITDPKSIEQCLSAIHQQHGDIDALICATGKAAFKPFAALTEQDWALGVSSKMMGQINLVTIAQKYLAKGASITLTSGVLYEQHILTGVSAAAMNGAVNAFVTGVAPVLENNVRINCVCPTVLEESMHIYKDYFSGFVPVPAKRVAQAYIQAACGIATGQIIKVY